MSNKIPALFRTPFDGTSLETKFKSVGLNSGNQVFTESIRKILGANVCHFNDYVWGDAKNVSSGNVVTTDLIWIRESSNFDYMLKQLELIGDKALVPISVGLQAESLDVNFKLNESVLNVLNALAERAVIGVRGYYTASVLEKHGIKNIQVIGCPSLYYWNDENFQMKKPKYENITKTMVNFRTMYGEFSKVEKHFLSYAADNNCTFIEQTAHDLKPEFVNDDKYFEYVSKWLKNKTEIHFTTKEWLDAMEGYQFSMGGRFHGNVIAMWKDIPALYMTVDSRTQEMIDFFGLPHIKLEDFNKSKPMEYYYEKADYTEFNKKYKQNFNNFQNFLAKNDLSLVK